MGPFIAYAEWIAWVMFGAWMALDGIDSVVLWALWVICLVILSLTQAGAMDPEANKPDPEPVEPPPERYTVFINDREWFASTMITDDGIPNPLIDYPAWAEWMEQHWRKLFQFSDYPYAEEGDRVEINHPSGIWTSFQIGGKIKYYVRGRREDAHGFTLHIIHPVVVVPEDFEDLPLIAKLAGAEPGELVTVRDCAYPSNPMTFTL